MYVIRVSADNDGRAFQVFTYPANIAVEFFFIRWPDQWLSVFCAEDDAHIILNE